MQFVSGNKHPIIRLRDVSMTCEIMSALHFLPHWASTLDFRDCTWPLPASEYTELAHCVPTSYTEWHLDRGCDQAVLDSICVGINERRARLGARPLVVRCTLERLLRVGEHVVLRQLGG